MKSRAPLAGVIVILSTLWCVLFSITLWIWLTLSHGGSAPPASGVPGQAAPRVAMVWTPASVSRFVERLEWAGLALVGILVAAVVIGAAVQEKARHRDE